MAKAATDRAPDASLSSENDDRAPLVVPAIVAILDALGASSFSDAAIDQFLKSRARVLHSMGLKMGGVHLDPARFSTFTFNDTVIISYATVGAATLSEAYGVCAVLRKLLIDSLANGILFRGALSIGGVRVQEETNTILGEAVSDAAAWYNKANWIGIHATPHATMRVRALVAGHLGGIDNLLVEYPVPMKTGPSIELRAVNWPKGFSVKGVTPFDGGEPPRTKCLELLARHRMPLGTEAKYFNALTFFDAVHAKKGKDPR